MIETKQLTKHYGDLAALSDLSLEIRQGDIFGFIGPNGAGKTTTMRILATLLEPTSGQATIDGLDVTRKGKDVRRRVGYMPDFMGVYDDLKVFEYLEFFAAAFDIPAAKRQGIVEGVLELTDLQSKKHATVDSLSRGMQQRLGLARVLIHDPKVLILDEPTVGLDPKSARLIKDILRQLADRGAAVLLSTHIMEIAERMCDRIGIINQGKVIAAGTMDDLRSMGGGQTDLEDIFLQLTGGAEDAEIAEVLK
jgi:ABC-2 type transport system ATP-binding protein